jgi:hypothetical protein
LSCASTRTVYVPSFEIETEGVQDNPSRETPWLARPEMASDEFAVMVTGETYQPFNPSGAGRLASATGGVISTWTIRGEVEAWFPAWSQDWNSTVCVPSVSTVTVEPSCQAPPFIRACTPAIPEVASLAIALKIAGETYQPPFPSSGEAEALREGETVSSLTVALVAAVFPALSVALATRGYTPSEETVKVLLPPLMLTPATPEMASVAEAEVVTGPEMNQPLSPSVPPDGVMESVGGVMSTFMEAEACKLVSPYEDNAQKVSEVLPSGKDQVQEELLHSIPSELSMPVMLYPVSGSLPDRFKLAWPVHQPLLPGLEQEVEPVTVAGG